MKHMKKIASLLLVLTLLLSLCVSASATQEGTLTGGSITIDSAVVGQTYNAYQILYIESYNATSGAYAYKANSAWKSFVESDAIKGIYLSTDAQGYVTWVKTLTCKSEEEGHTHGDDCYTPADAAAFAKLAQVEAAKMAADATATATTTTVKFENLKLGYYLIDTTLGTLCSLDTTNPNATVREKNEVPTNEKKVQEDSKTGDNSWGPTNDADIGQDVDFKSTVTLPVGSENVVFKDQMSAGLTLKTGSIKVYTDAEMTTELAATNYTLDTTATNDYTFKITFAQTYLDSLTTATTLYVAYTATVNDKAVVGLNGNANDSWLDYGDSTNTKSTPKSETITYTWDMDVLKYANGVKTDVLQGVKFVLLNTAKSKVATFENGKITGWVDVPTAGTDGTITWPENTVLTTGANGKIEIDGLDADTYYLREIEALPGFNIAADIEVKITGATETEGEDGTKTLTYTTVVTEVNNQSGTELPSTGGMGTTLFYVVGAVLVLAAAVLLITKKRMKANG